MRKNPSYTALLRPTRLLISEKSATYTIEWSYTIIWQVRVSKLCKIAKNCEVLLHIAHSKQLFNADPRVLLVMGYMAEFSFKILHFCVLNLTFYNLQSCLK